MVENDYSAERIAARMEIQDRIHQFARGVDRRDWQLMRSVFHPDATDDHCVFKGTVDGLIRWAQERHASGIHLSIHHVSNIQIEFASDTVALVETYCYAWQRVTVKATADGPEQLTDMFMANRYVDRFTKRAATWKIERRLTVFEAGRGFPVLDDAVKPGADWLTGRRDSSDTLMRERAALGLV
jgi:hypothetical protein